MGFRSNFRWNPILLLKTPPRDFVKIGEIPEVNRLLSPWTEARKVLGAQKDADHNPSISIMGFTGFILIEWKLDLLLLLIHINTMIMVIQPIINPRLGPAWVRVPGFLMLGCEWNISWDYNGTSSDP